MWVSRLQVTDFRSYAAADLELAPGAVVLVGPNGQGKTNLVEAIAYSSALDSHRVHGDAALVRAGCDRAVIRTTVATTTGREATVELQLNPGRANRLQLNGQAVPRSRDVVGTVRCAVFAPEHLRLVKVIRRTGEGSWTRSWCRLRRGIWRSGPTSSVRSNNATPPSGR